MKNDKKTTKTTLSRSTETNINVDKDDAKKKQDQEISDKYTDGDNGLAEGVRENNPNRNVDKEDATNAGGYKQ